MAGLELTDEGLEALVNAFYARVRQDSELGPVFNDAVDDWPAHLEKLSAFWSSVMRTTGRYKGQPLPAHMKHKSNITPALFERWLALWGETSDALMTPEAAAAVQTKAARIAESLQLALFFRLGERPNIRLERRSSGERGFQSVDACREL
ncbi:group III truncated hemoglobin [Sphingomonas sp. MMSM20]|uniref:group III truncated hemoglobin n=1 Tax=Sphingomonas lycopersici TaxID=2951807 RepID=UPI0022370F4B|nr:group III truncated hemoglobin [Sphingomonas lycopersici]MCW6531974.1 group III truncated hemoglobin [Sphingomonas lycopersici]